MGTASWGCGCSVSTSMYSDNSVLSITVCTYHTIHKDVQDALHKAAEMLRDVCLANPAPRAISLADMILENSESYYEEGAD